MRIAITGGSGFVGGHLIAQFRALGHDVKQLARGEWGEGHAAEAASAQSPQERASQLEGLDVLIHAAWDLSNPETNVAMSNRLFDAAKAAGVSHNIFISSLSAFEGCRSRYGSTKLAVEKAVAAMGGCSIRLGFVCDDSGRGLSGALRKLATLPVIPLPGGGKQNLYTIRAEDLGPAFLKILEQCDAGPVNLAHPEPVTVAGMMRAFARQQGKGAIFLPLPWRLLWAPLRLAEAAGLKLKFRSDSLVSLMNQNPAPDFRRLREWDIAMRPFDDKSQPKMIPC